MLRTRLGRIIRDIRRRIIALLVGFGISPIRDLVVGRTIDVMEWVPAVSAVPSYGNPRCCCIDQCALGPSSPRTIAQQVEVLRKGYVRRCGVKAASLRFNSLCHCKHNLPDQPHQRPSWDGNRIA